MAWEKHGPSFHTFAGPSGQVLLVIKRNDLYPPAVTLSFDNDNNGERDFRDEVLRRVPGLFASRIDTVLLYGSRGRGDARAESDWDVAVVLRYTLDLGRDRSRLIMLSLALRNETRKDAQFFALMIDDLAVEGVLQANIRRDGVLLGRRVVGLQAEPGRVAGWDDVDIPQMCRPLLPGRNN